MNRAVQTTPDSDFSSKVPRRRWGIAWLLGFGVLVNYFDRVNLSVSQAALHSEFGISTVTFGYLLSAYSWTYALLQMPSGLLLDRFGVRLVGRISTILWSIASFGAAISTGIGGFFAARLLLGMENDQVLGATGFLTEMLPAAALVGFMGCNEKTVAQREHGFRQGIGRM